MISRKNSLHEDADSAIDMTDMIDMIQAKINAKNIKLAPSILSADFGRLNEEIAEIEADADYLHIDVMDGHFVNNITIGPCVIKHIKSRLPLDAHLMISNPWSYIEQFAKAGADIISVHDSVHSDMEHLRETIALIKKHKCKACVVLNPDREIDGISDIIDDVDMVLVMSVFPGFAGQKFIPDVLDKIKKLRKMRPDLDIEIDGGINKNNIGSAVKAGANVIVAGSAIFGQKDRLKAIEELKRHMC